MSPHNLGLWIPLRSWAFQDCRVIQPCLCLLDVCRVIELLDRLQRSGELPPPKLQALQRVLQSKFCAAIREVYEQLYDTLDIVGGPEVRAQATAKDLQRVLERFAAECEAAGMRISTSKSEAMVLDRKRVACPLWVGGEVLPQVEEFKYLGVLFTVVVKKELSRKAKLSIYRSIYVPTLTYGHELWVMTERTRSRIQAAEMSFLRRVAGRSLRDRVRSSVTREELGVEPLLLHIERSQLRWPGHLFRMPPGRLPREVFQACPTGRRPRGRPRTRWRDYVSRLAWERLGVPPEELEEVSGATVAAFAASEGHAHPRVVELPKTEEGLGFNIMGGKEQNSPIYISRVIPGGVADRQGGLKRGDQLLSVNGVSVEGEHHEKAVELLKAAQGSVKLVVRYTPKVLEEMEARFEKMRSARRRQQHTSYS
ncbi:hypothetical protein L3Q82_014587 [Scortum barcoo]|uniref:Uncharacterized protein n=1 Tax=Scortum barcoo TaxID=214431 RepID=A0ACB8VXX6_9TELE|nr:hypothetical protein L3Q82_014587 [Scortum barcoo]